MFDRILDHIRSPRRHLAVLVGLLVLTFAFTGLLAVEARRAEIARQQIAQGVLRDMVSGAADAWEMRLQTLIQSSLHGALERALPLLVRNPYAPLTEIEARATLEQFCVDCATSFRSAPFVSLALSGPAVGLDPVLAGNLRSRVLAGQYATLHDNIGTALYVASAGDSMRALAAYVLLDGAGGPIRVIGFHVPTEVMEEIAAVTFGLTRIMQPTLSQGLPNSTFFDADVFAAESPADSMPGDDYGVVKTLHAGPIAGLELHVGVRPDAADRLVIGGTTTARLPLLLGVMIAIAGLIGMALLLVRREAELVRLRADFVSSVSHELRTPLAQIRMFTETLLLGRTRSDVERRRSLEIIDQEARRLTHLVENVLLLSKSEGGRTTRIAPEPTMFAGEIRRALESFAPMCRSRDVELRVELQENITAPVDRGALRQILINLVDNALKYGPASQRITVGVALFGEVARMWVDDEGPGIPSTDREHVFESFHRLPRDIERRTTGSGIGLAVVRELAVLHGGHAWADDAPGGGGRLVVEFPGAYLRQEPAARLPAAS